MGGFNRPHAKELGFPMSNQDNQRLSIFDDDEAEASTHDAAAEVSAPVADPVDAEKTQVIPTLPAAAADPDEAPEPEPAVDEPQDEAPVAKSARPAPEPTRQVPVQKKPVLPPPPAAQ